MSLVELPVSQPESQPELSAFMVEQIASLTRLLELADEEEAQRRAELERIQADRRRIKRALDSLTGQQTTPVAASSKRKQQRDWTLSEAKIQQVWEIIRTLPDEFCGSDLRKLGFSPEVARRSLLTLRERELIRVTRSLRGGGKAYKLMPGAADIETAAA